MTGDSTTSRSAAAAAARSSSAGSSAGRARRSSTTSPADSATPAASGSSRGRRSRDTGRASTPSTRRQVSRDRWVSRRPISRTCRWAARSSSSPSLAARSAHSSGATRSVARPARSCTTSRTSSSASRLRSRSLCGTSTNQVATSARSIVASRSPPSASLRSGTERWASSPISWWREVTIRRSSGSRARAPRRHWASTVVRSRSARFGSPATWRTSSSPEATRTSASAAVVISGNERTEWSSRAPLSHSGYHTSEATGPGSTPSSCTSTTSRSEWGASSPRPYPPTATSAMPASGPPHPS